MVLMKKKAQCFSQLLMEVGVEEMVVVGGRGGGNSWEGEQLSGGGWDSFQQQNDRGIVSSFCRQELVVLKDPARSVDEPTVSASLGLKGAEVRATLVNGQGMAIGERGQWG